MNFKNEEPAEVHQDPLDSFFDNSLVRNYEAGKLVKTLRNSFGKKSAHVCLLWEYLCFLSLYATCSTLGVTHSLYSGNVSSSCKGNTPLGSDMNWSLGYVIFLSLSRFTLKCDSLSPFSLPSCSLKKVSLFHCFSYYENRQ